MKRFTAIASFALVAALGTAAVADTSTIGVGETGFFFLAGGNWHCKTNASSGPGGGRTEITELTQVSPQSVLIAEDGPIDGRVFFAYDRGSSLWRKVAMYVDGTTTSETTSSTGSHIVFTGSETDPSEAMVKIRDNIDYDLGTAWTYVDVGQTFVNGAWTDTYKTECALQPRPKGGKHGV